MKIFALKNQKGVTLLEAVIGSGLLTLALLATLAMLTNMLSIWMKGASGTSANTHASLAMRKISTDIQEGRSASVVNGELVVKFPFLDSSTGDYIRHQPGHTAVYYLSGETGSESSGTYLWRSIEGSKTKLAKNISEISFIVENNKLVRIQLVGVDQEGGAITPNLVRASIKLRNS